MRPPAGGIGHDGAGSEAREGLLMPDKSPHKSNDKKQGRSLVEKRAAKRQKRSQRADEAQSRTQLEGH
jgi:hypothetical protein